jgi:crotonobetainyl-CoA:carnitine CoA-transferase CaiB-like acyl-CoA transferase
VARVLCEFGAEVIRCETRLRGDGHRGEDPAKWNKNPDFMKLQRGKKSFTVNMQTPRGRELVKELAKKSDVVVENYVLGILEKWGLDWPQLKEINPACILIRVKGMGCSGPHAADLTYGPNVGNTMATTYLWNYPDAQTATAEPRTQHPDFMGGVTGAFGVVLALIQRKKTGRGQWIDSAQVEIGASLLGPKYLEYSVNHREPKPEGNRSLVAAPYGPYQCKGNDRWCVIAVYSQDEWERFSALLQKSGLKPNDKLTTHLGRVRHKDELDQWVTSWTLQHDPYDDEPGPRRRCLRGGRPGCRGPIQTRRAIRRHRLSGEHDGAGRRRCGDGKRADALVGDSRKSSRPRPAHGRAYPRDRQKLTWLVRRRDRPTGRRKVLY